MVQDLGEADSERQALQERMEQLRQSHQQELHSLQLQVAELPDLQAGMQVREFFHAGPHHVV